MDTWAWAHELVGSHWLVNGQKKSNGKAKEWIHMKVKCEISMAHVRGMKERKAKASQQARWCRQGPQIWKCAFVISLFLTGQLISSLSSSPPTCSQTKWCKWEPQALALDDVGTFLGSPPFQMDEGDWTNLPNLGLSIKGQAPPKWLEFFPVVFFLHFFSKCI